MKPIFLLLLGAACALADDKVPVIKAKTEEPVIEEMLGGCSLKCAFPWAVEFQANATAKPKAISELNDESAQTAWIVPEPGTGVGARFRLRFPQKLPKEEEGNVPFYGFDLINGYWKSEELWAQYGRLKKARFYYNNQPFKDVVFANSRRWQRVSFEDVMIHSGDSMTVEVLEIYPGTKGGLALSEIVLMGAH